MTLIKLKEHIVITRGETSAVRTYEEDFNDVWINADHIAEIRMIGNPVESHRKQITQIRFSFGTSNMTPGRTINVAETPNHIKELAKIARHN